MSNYWKDILYNPDINMLKDGQMSGALSQRVAQLFSLANDDGMMTQAPISIDPGDFAFVGDNDNAGRALSLPVAYDVWYLWQTKNLIYYTDKAKQFFDLYLAPMFGKRVKPSILRTITKRNTQELPDLNFFKTNGIYYIKEMRFETLLHDRSPYYDSPGSESLVSSSINHEGRGIGDVYSGYLAFPIGALGVMRNISIATQTMLEDPTYLKQDNSEEPLKGEELLPPLKTQDDACLGENLIELSYVKSNIHVEYPAKEMFATEEILPHHWLRYWIPKESIQFKPGEMVVMITKAQSIPPHCWWYQETNPFIYSGNWFETEYYTSGIVIGILKEVERVYEKTTGNDTVTYEIVEISQKHAQKQGYGELELIFDKQYSLKNELGNIYKVRVKDQDLYLKSSDFLEYSIDERVAIRKSPGIRIKNFTWEQLEAGCPTPGKTYEEQKTYDKIMSNKFFKINRDWEILPITFYKGD